MKRITIIRIICALAAVAALSSLSACKKTDTGVTLTTAEAVTETAESTTITADETATVAAAGETATAAPETTTEPVTIAEGVTIREDAVVLEQPSASDLRTYSYDGILSFSAPKDWTETTDGRTYAVMDNEDFFNCGIAVSRDYAYKTAQQIRDEFASHSDVVSCSAVTDATLGNSIQAKAFTMICADGEQDDLFVFTVNGETVIFNVATTNGTSTDWFDSMLKTVTLL